MNAICVIGVYFGKLPPYFDLWVKSCAYNPTIDFLVFTDDAVKTVFPNIKIIPFTLDQMKTLASDSLNMEVFLDRPYKCCDFRPAYGLILERYLRQYTYWGHCDFDLIFGDIKGFLESENLTQYDKFLTFGHLSLYRNTCENNKRFQLDGSIAGDYKYIFASEKNLYFDEHGINEIYKKHGFSVYEQRIFADIPNIYTRFRLGQNDTNYDHQVFYWEKGHVYRAYLKDDCIYEDEFIYIHFKRRSFPAPLFEAVQSDAYFVTPQGFFEKKAPQVLMNDIDQYNPFRSHLYEKLQHYKYFKIKAPYELTYKKK